MQAGCGGVGIVDQPPKGFLVLVLPSEAPEAAEQPDEVVHRAVSCIQGRSRVGGEVLLPAGGHCTPGQKFSAPPDREVDQGEDMGTISPAQSSQQ